MFITIDGINGSGKTTQAKLLAERLRSEYPHRPVHLLRNPGIRDGHPANENLRPLARYGDWKNPMTRMMIYQAARCELTAEIKELLADGAFVVSDRYASDYYAYGIPSFETATGGRDSAARDAIAALLRLCGTIEPDVGVYLLVDVDLAMERWAQVSGDNPDVYERGGIQKMSDLHYVYVDLITNSGEYPFTGRIKIVPPQVTMLNTDEWPPARVHESIWRGLGSRLPNKGRCVDG